MTQTVSDLLKRHLPPRLVTLIKACRKAYRQYKRYRLGKGKDLLRQVALSKHSFCIFVNPYLNGGVDEVVFDTGVWEPEITALIDQYLPVGGTCIDIGANIGFHSLYAASVVGPSGSVVSFEPLPRLQAQMQRSVEGNGFHNVSVQPVALGMTKGTATLSLVDENIGASSLQNVDADRAVGTKVTVPVHTLDSYVQDFSRLDLIKIDIEGSEFEALRGGENVIRRFRPVIILEFSPHVYEKDWVGKSLEFYEYLSGLGYVITDIEKQVVNIEANLKAANFTLLHTNLLCVPQPKINTL